MYTYLKGIINLSIKMMSADSDKTISEESGYFKEEWKVDVGKFSLDSLDAIGEEEQEDEE